MQDQNQKTFQELIEHVSLYKNTCKIYENGSYRNLVTSKAIKAQETLIQTPYQLLLTHRNYKCSLLSKYLYFILEKGDEQEIMIAKEIVEEKSPTYMLPFLYLFQNQFISKAHKIEKIYEKLYFQLLPQDYGSMPYFHLNLIKQNHDKLTKEIQEQITAVTSTYQHIRQIIRGHQQLTNLSFKKWLRKYVQDGKYIYQIYCQEFTLDNFIWSYFTWISRTFDCPKQVRSNFPVQFFLAPGIDMINHSLTKQNVRWNFKQNSLEVVALYDIQAGSQLFFQYSENRMTYFFSKYGFVNADDQVQVELQVNVSTKSSILRVQCYPFDQNEKTNEFFKAIIEKFVSEVKNENEKLHLDQQQILNLLQNQVQTQQKKRSDSVMKMRQLATKNYLSSQQTHIIQSLYVLLRCEIAVLHKLSQVLLQKQKESMHIIY